MLIRPHQLDLAIAALHRGDLVAVPTETVYGLAADASNPAAVAKIFAAKGRPPNHPLIVHVPLTTPLEALARHIPDGARALMEAFWPGPLTLVFEKTPAVSDQVTGGLPTVGVRCPNQPVMQRLLEGFGGWIAAPSANRFKAVSPTTAQHVQQDLGDRVAYVVDGGPCRVGIESTIVDMTCSPPMVLRPGALTFRELSSVLGGRLVRGAEGRTVTRSPGQMQAHYQPRARVVVTDDVDGAVAQHPDAAVVRVGGDLEGFARGLYAAFRRADAQGKAVIVVERPPAEGLGEALRDRLSRAAGR